jgi:hypothetical protein
VYRICADSHEQDLPILYCTQETLPLETANNMHLKVEKDSRAEMLYKLRRAMLTRKVSSEKWCERYYELIEEKTKHGSQY